MKLTSLSADGLRRLLCDLSGPLCAMLRDERLSPILSRLTAPELPLPQAGAILLGELLPLVLRDHEQDFFTAAALLTHHTEEDVRAMPALELIALLRQTWDQELTAFFASAGIAPRARSSAQ